jgi:Uma2 family endonuclease
MKMLVVLDPEEQRHLIRRRRAWGADRKDEVWNGVYVMPPDPDNEHQHLAGRLVHAFHQALGDDESFRVYPGINVSDRPKNWKKNFRCPDAAVFLPGNPAEDRKTHWFGGPDFAVEILSPRDRSRKKLPFYAGVGVRELLLVNRKPWRLELFRLQDGRLDPAGRCEPGQPEALASTVLPLTFRLVPGTPRPQLEVARPDRGKMWLA